MRRRTLTNAPVRPEAELLLLLAGTQSRRQAHANRIRALGAMADPQRLMREMARQRLVPLLGSRLVECAREEVSPRLAEDVSEVTVAAIRQGAAQEMAMLHLVGMLERQGLPCLPLKGQALSRVLYGGPGLRTSTDIDLLVSPDDLWDAVAVLEEEGFRAVADRRARGGRPLLHTVLRPPRDTGLPSVEVHWRLHWYEETFATRLLERSEVDDRGSRRATPADELAALLLFYARDGFVGLRHPTDIAARIDATEAPIRIEALDEIVAEHPLLGPPLRTATIACSQVAGTPGLSLRPLSSARRERLAVRFANWSGCGDADQLAANVSLVDALLSPPGTMRTFARRQLTAPDATTTTAAHASKTLARFAAGLWMVRRGRAAYAPAPQPVSPRARGA